MSKISKATIKKVEKIVHDEKLMNMLSYLRQRWQDEKDFEDWADYDLQMKKFMAKHYKQDIRKTTKRPIGFITTIGNVDIKINLKLTKTTESVTAAQV